MLTPTQIQSKPISLPLSLREFDRSSTPLAFHRTRRELLRCRLREPYLARDPSRCQRSCRRWRQERSPPFTSRGRRSWTLRNSSPPRGYRYRGEYFPMLRPCSQLYWPTPSTDLHSSLAHRSSSSPISSTRRFPLDLPPSSVLLYNLSFAQYMYPSLLTFPFASTLFLPSFAFLRFRNSFFLSFTPALSRLFPLIGLLRCLCRYAVFSRYTQSHSSNHTYFGEIGNFSLSCICHFLAAATALQCRGVKRGLRGESSKSSKSQTKNTKLSPPHYLKSSGTLDLAQLTSNL